MTTKFTTKRIENAAEFEAVRSVALEVWPLTFRDLMTQAQIDYMINMMYAPEVFCKEHEQGIIWELVSVNGEPAGYVSYSAYKDSIAKLHKVYLHQKFQGIGLGTELLRYVQAECKKLGYTQLRLHVNKQNRKAIDCYLRNGFEQIEAAEFDIGGGFIMDDYILQITIK